MAKAYYGSSGGPNAAPAIRGNYLVALGSQGDLVCVNPANGKEYWNKSLTKQLGLKPSESPLRNF